jgi:hypothetical protein
MRPDAIAVVIAIVRPAIGQTKCRGGFEPTSFVVDGVERTLNWAD